LRRPTTISAALSHSKVISPPPSKVCRRAVELDPRLADAHNNLGNALRGMGELERAEAALRQAVALAPERSDLHANLGNVLFDLRRFQTSGDPSAPSD